MNKDMNKRLFKEPTLTALCILSLVGFYLIGFYLGCVSQQDNGIDDTQQLSSIYLKAINQACYSKQSQVIETFDKGYIVATCGGK